MGFISWLLGKKPKNVGYWYLVDWSDAAKEFAVGSDYCKKIHTMYNTSFTGVSEDYTDAKIKILRINHGVIIDRTEGHMVPSDSVNIPRQEVAFGTIQLFKRAY